MSQCVPRWDLNNNSDSNPNLPTKVTLHAPSNSISSNLHVPILDYEVAELTWENGQLAMHGLGTRRVRNKPQSTTSTLTKYTWDKPRAAETLEAIVNQATLIPHRKTKGAVYEDELVPWLGHHNAAVGGGAATASATMTLDALVPSSNNRANEQSANAMGCSTYVGSCSGGPSAFDDRRVARRVAPTGSPTTATYEGSSCRDQSVSGSATFGMESSRQWTLDTPDGDFCVRGFTSTSMGSPENTSSGKNCTKSTSPDEHDSVSHGRHQNIMTCSKRDGRDVEEKKKGKGKSSSTNKRSRAAAIHNQSERKRRDKINQRMKALQKLVPNSNKTDKASMLDEAIEYLKQLQAQVQMMTRMNMSSMMMPLAMQQQMQMSMMMGMGMGMHGVMDLNTIGRPSIAGMSAGFNPSTFMPPMAPVWDGHGGDRMMTIPTSLNTDAMSAFLSRQPQSMTMDAYSRMAALYQQMQTQPCGPVPNN